MGKIYLTSDLHLCHDKPFIYEPRGFKTIQEMNNAIIENWNSIVSMDDDVYVLGDLLLNDNEKGIQLIKNLKGNIHVVLGNHDSNSRMLLYMDCYNINQVEYGIPLKYNGYHFFLTHYPTLCSNYDTDKPLKKKMINLCGHIHTKDRFHDFDKGIIYHVELDAHDNKPVLIDNIIEDIKDKIG